MRASRDPVRVVRACKSKAFRREAWSGHSIRTCVRASRIGIMWAIGPGVPCQPGIIARLFELIRGKETPHPEVNIVRKSF